MEGNFSWSLYLCLEFILVNLASLVTVLDKVCNLMIKKVIFIILYIVLKIFTLGEVVQICFFARIELKTSTYK